MYMCMRGVCVRAYFYMCMDSYRFSVLLLVQDFDIVGHHPMSSIHGRTISVQWQRHTHRQNKTTTEKQIVQDINNV